MTATFEIVKTNDGESFPIGKVLTLAEAASFLQKPMAMVLERAVLEPEIENSQLGVKVVVINQPSSPT